MGVRVACTATCLDKACDWSCAGPAVQVDRDADKHTRKTSHGTSVSCQPVKE